MATRDVTKPFIEIRQAAKVRRPDEAGVRFKLGLAVGA
jgi:hypothetical protein